MNCRTCHYPLWNLRERRCPECGDPFNISDYEFTPSSVQYCCPHCMQPYYGLSATGHLIPEEFDCVKCGRHIHMASMVLLPGEGVREEQTRAFVLPWLQRRERGRFSAWLATVGWGFGRPVDIGKTLHGEPKTGEALRFGMLTMLIVTVMMIVLPMIACGLIWAVSGGGGPMGPGFGVFLISIVAAIIGSFIVINACALMTHGLLWATGPCATTVGGTLESMNYATGPFIMCAIPCLGGYITPISWIWWTVSSVFAVMHRQEVAAWRAILAVVLPLLIAPVLLFGMWMGSIFMTRNSLVASGPMPPAVAQMRMGRMNDAINAWVVAHPDEPLRHPLQLADGGNLTAQDFVSSWQISPDQVPVGDSTLEDFVFWVQIGGATPQEVDAAILAEIEAIPENAAAIRLGEFVFPYDGRSVLPQGYGTEAVPGGVWIAMMAPAYDIDRTAYYDDSIVVIRADGSTMTYRTRREFRTALTVQNELRASIGIAKLPNPDDVKHVGK